MPFWKKSEDPWDYEPEKHPAPSAEAGGGEDAPGFLEELRGDFQNWNQERKEKKAQREIPPPPMACPWCGQEMEAGYITGGRDGANWWPGWPPKVLGPGNGAPIRVDHEGTVLLRYKTAWLCRACRRMVLEIPEEEIPKPLTPEEAAARAEEQRQQEAQRKISRGLQG